MSLAAALAADGVRPVSFLPSIKCSDCGDEIQIAEMGDHVCTTSPLIATRAPATIGTINPFTLRRMNARGQQPAATLSSQSQSASTPHIDGTSFDTAARTPVQKPQRTPLPRINSVAANKPFLAPRPAPLELPLSPALSSRSGSSSVGKSGYLRSMTSPAPRLFDFRPPSPELSANLDCAFPPFPTSTGAERRPSTSQSSDGRKTPTDSERAASRGGSRLDHVMLAEPEPLDMARMSPYFGTNSNVLQEVDNLKSGPFNSTRRNASGDRETESTRRPSLAPVEDNRPVTATHYDLSPQRNDDSDVKSYPFNESNDQKKVPPPRPARPTEEVLRLSFLDQMSEEPVRMMAASLSQNNSQDSDTSRSHTYPSLEDAGEHGVRGNNLVRMRSEPQLHVTARRPSLKESADRNRPDIFQDGEAHPTGRRTDRRHQDAPPVPKAVLSYRENLTHTPTGSSSSATSSTNSRANTSSSGISPAGSVASSLETFAPLSTEPRGYGGEDQMRVPAFNVSRSPKKSAQSYQRPALDQDAPQYPRKASLSPLESPMDPALSKLQERSGHAFEPWTSMPTGPALTKTQPMPTSTPSEHMPAPAELSRPRRVGSTSSNTEHFERPRSASIRSSSSRMPEPQGASTNVLQPPPMPQKTPARRQHGIRLTNAKPRCRGCGLMIEGKSVKAADGRLTGRWHKACFVCRSCQQPFMTADFYVINNEPYCEQHYHEKNGSLCHGCHRGIEGQYLETSSSTRFGSVDKKFHPRCFTCCECRMVLAQDYFEMTGKVYCERHALAAMRAQARLGSGLQSPDRRNLIAERRTTRLIHPMMA